MDTVIELMRSTIPRQRSDVSSRETHVRQIESDAIGVAAVQAHELMAPVIEEPRWVRTPVVVVIDPVQVEDVLHKDSQSHAVMATANEPAIGTASVQESVPLKTRIFKVDEILPTKVSGDERHTVAQLFGLKREHRSAHGASGRSASPLRNARGAERMTTGDGEGVVDDVKADSTSLRHCERSEERERGEPSRARPAEQVKSELRCKPFILSHLLACPNKAMPKQPIRDCAQTSCAKIWFKGV